jgi:hemolysin activation/secretion protein
VESWIDEKWLKPAQERTFRPRIAFSHGEAAEVFAPRCGSSVLGIPSALTGGTPEARWCRAAVLAFGLAPSLSSAQVPFFGDPTGRSGEQPSIQREELRPPSAPVPALPKLAPPLPGDFELVPSVQVFVREIRIVGVTVFSREEIEAVTRPYLNRTVTHEDLEALRLALTRLYVDRGYVNSGAILPDQRVTEGVVTYQIVEGALTEIELEGNQWFKAEYLRRRLALGAGPPLNVNELQERLQLLLEDQRIRRLSAEIKPGVQPGEAALKVQVEERSPYRFAFELNNYQSPSVGAERGIVTAEHQNLTGNGDILRLQYGRSRGLDPLLDFKYALPVNAHDTIVVLQYRKNTYIVVEEPFDRLDVRSESDIYGITVRHPLRRTRDTELALELTGERLGSKTLLLGEPFTLSPGAHRGESYVTAIRFAQEFVHRTAEEVIAARSRFSVGIDALGATINDEPLPSGKFFAWLGQFQWVRRLPALDSQLILRADTQLTPDSLLGLEQFAVGGRYTVRGYRENTFVRDNALVLSAEARLPVARNVRWADYVEIAPFVDAGKAWNSNSPGDRAPYITSAGVGLRWGARLPGTLPLRAQFEVYWGYPFRRVFTGGSNLQDQGIHFNLIVGAF